MFKPNRRQRARTASLPAPVGGWNARDSLAEMDAKDAIILDNWFPLPSDVMVRKGYVSHVNGFASPVETLAVYNSGTSSKMFAWSNDAIYDVTTPGAIGSPVVSGLTNARWEWVNFATPGGTFLYAVNGYDKPLLYDGSVWKQIDNTTTPSISGVTSSYLNNITTHKMRVWFVERNSLRAWFLPVVSIGGAASPFDMGQIFRKGGYLVALETWTLDAGYGVDDHFVAITSEGEVAVYRGTDPASASAWSLVGVYQIGAPIGSRALVKFGGDVIVIGADGLAPLSKALMSSRVSTNSTLTDKIQSAISEATGAYSANNGWQAMPFPTANMLILNVPLSATEQHQYVMNTITGAWARFKGWNATCFTSMDDALFFGSSDGVYRAWEGSSDNGATIYADALPAFSYFGGMTQLKRWSMARPVLSANIAPGVTFGLNTDFSQQAPVNSPSFSPFTAGTWDAGTWGSSLWSGGLEIKKDWQTVSGVGYCASLYMKVAARLGVVKWASVDYVFEPGGIV